MDIVFSVDPIILNYYTSVFLICFIPDLLHVQLGKLVAWRGINPDRWPSTRSENEDEKRLGTWLGNQRMGKNAMDAGKTGAALRGMTQERDERLDEACPGWRNDDSDPWGDQVSFCCLAVQIIRHHATLSYQPSRIYYLHKFSVHA